MTVPLLSIKDLAVGFRRDGTVTPAVHTLSLDIMPGEEECAELIKRAKARCTVSNSLNGEVNMKMAG